MSGSFTGGSALSLQDAQTNVGKFGLIVQTTSVGMNFAESGIPLDPAGITEGTIVADIIYNPLETEFLRRAREAGGKTLNGIGMFVHQGALAFELMDRHLPGYKENDSINYN